MIKITEVRIGNKVDLFGTIATIQKNDICGNGIAIKSGKPLKITEDILIKSGFEKVSENGFINGNIKLVKHSNHDTFGLYVENYSGGDMWIILPIIKNYHHLQNLYFALTNEELNLSFG